MPMYDLLIKGGRVVDPGSERVGYFDLAVSGDRIAALAADIPTAEAREVIDAAGLLVTPGLIDLHAHVSGDIDFHGVDPDVAGVLQGVTTVVDGGSTGSHTFAGFRRYVIRPARTAVLCFLGLPYSGQARLPELRSRDEIDEETTAAVLATNAGLIRGIKLRLVSPTVETVGAEALTIATRLAATIGGMVMVHVGDLNGAGQHARELTPRIVDALRPGDILSHPYTCWPGRLVGEDGTVAPEALEAAARGVVIDVARGQMGLTLANARCALDAGFLPTTISSDLSAGTLRGPVFGLADTASIFLNLGMPLQDVIVRVTANPARVLGIFDRVGSLAPGKVADISLFDYRERGPHEFFGFEDERLSGDKLLVPVLTLKNGQPIAPKLPPGSAMQRAAKEYRPG